MEKNTDILKKDQIEIITGLLEIRITNITDSCRQEKFDPTKILGLLKTYHSSSDADEQKNIRKDLVGIKRSFINNHNHNTAHPIGICISDLYLNEQ